MHGTVRSKNPNESLMAMIQDRSYGGQCAINPFKKSTAFEKRTPNPFAGFMT